MPTKIGWKRRSPQKIKCLPENRAGSSASVRGTYGLRANAHRDRLAISIGYKLQLRSVKSPHSHAKARRSTFTGKIENGPERGAVAAFVGLCITYRTQRQEIPNSPPGRQWQVSEKVQASEFFAMDIRFRPIARLPRIRRASQELSLRDRAGPPPSGITPEPVYREPPSAYNLLPGGFRFCSPVFRGRAP